MVGSRLAVWYSRQHSSIAAGRVDRSVGAENATRREHDRPKEHRVGMYGQVVDHSCLYAVSGQMSELLPELVLGSPVEKGTLTWCGNANVASQCRQK